LNEPSTSSRLSTFLRRHGQTIFNVYLFLNVAGWAGWQTWKTWAAGRMDYVEASFAIQTLIFAALLLVRRPHVAVDRSVFNQAVALVAFWSGFGFMGPAETAQAAARTVSAGITLAANILGAICLLNLGRSFGILIALRRVKTRGLYAVVRHPMYATDILLRVGFLVSHPTWLISGLFLLSTVCYVYRAILEERFLAQQPEYREYLARVKWRFIPFVF
jgi:protein-S-isoprenylcysteine O-methyltransferase Ste14